MKTRLTSGVFNFGDDDEEEEEPPNFVPIKTFAMNKKVYEKPLKPKDIKSIYKRLAPE